MVFLAICRWMFKFHCCTYPVCRFGFIRSSAVWRVAAGVSAGLAGCAGSGGRGADADVAAGSRVGEERHRLGEAGRGAIHRTGGCAHDAVVEDAVAAADRSLAVAERIPGEAEAGREVLPVVAPPFGGRLHGEVVGLAGGIEDVGGSQDSLLAVLLVRHGEEFPAQPDIQGQVMPDLPIVLREEAVLVEQEVAHARRAGGLKCGQVAVVGFRDRRDAAQQIVLHALEGGELRGGQAGRNQAGIENVSVGRAEGDVGIDAGVVEAVLRGEADLAAELEGVVAVDLGQVVGVFVDRGVAALRKGGERSAWSRC